MASGSQSTTLSLRCKSSKRPTVGYSLNIDHENGQTEATTENENGQTEVSHSSLAGFGDSNRPERSRPLGKKLNKVIFACLLRAEGHSRSAKVNQKS